jgi:L-seryl-tRNA(Ser) seleniumtransferase
MTPKPAASALRRIPSVDQLLTSDAGRGLVAQHGRELVTRAVRETLDAVRASLKDGDGPPPDAGAILGRVRARIETKRAPKLCRVINATGVILHTGLGRAVLPAAALDAIAAEQRGYSLLEVDRATGDRNHREVHLVELLREISGAEAATVVNNNAAATMISLAALAKGREVVVSRGQLVEIGGSFRIPEVMEQSGCALVEVGTTNKTRIEDYERRIGPATALLLKVHTSNFRVMGFTESASLEELVALGRKRGLPVMDDMGSGAFVDLAPYGITGEPVVQDSVKAGADVITFSGDKLLGGPQAGLIVGKKGPVAAIRRHPLFRAFRVDKLTLTALEATLKLYLDRERLMREHPTLRMISMGAGECGRRAAALAEAVRALPGWTVEVLDDTSEIGGGSVPAQSLPTKAVAVRHKALSLEAVDARLRAGTPCVFARVQRERVLFDVRTLLEGDAEEIVAALRTMG